jgi:predicted ester cyclase
MRRDTEFARAFSDIRIIVEEMVAEGDAVISRMAWTATHTGQFQWLAPTGKRFTITGFGLDRFRDGKVVEHIPLFDQLSMLQQLGVAGEPAQQEALGRR